jgi:chromosome partitioning protein
MTRVLAVANQKGGVGKSTTAVNVAAYLAMSGSRTLLVDMDPQGNASSGVGFSRDPDRPSVYDVVIEGHSATEAITPTSVEGLDAIPSDIALAGAEIELINMPRRESRLLYALDAVLPQYEYIIADCPPSLGLLTLNALVAAKYLLVPIQCEFYALEGLSHLAYTLDLVRRSSNPELELVGIVMTLFDRRTTLSSQVVEEVRKIYPEVIFDTLIPRNVRLSEAPSYGLTIAQYDPKSKGAKAYAALTTELSRRFQDRPSGATPAPGTVPDAVGAPEATPELGLGWDPSDHAAQPGAGAAGPETPAETDEEATAAPGEPVGPQPPDTHAGWEVPPPFAPTPPDAPPQSPTLWWPGGPDQARPGAPVDGPPGEPRPAHADGADAGHELGSGEEAATEGHERDKKDGGAA